MSGRNGSIFFFFRWIHFYLILTAHSTLHILSAPSSFGWFGPSVPALAPCPSHPGDSPLLFCEAAWLPVFQCLVWHSSTLMKSARWKRRVGFSDWFISHSHQRTVSKVTQWTFCKIWKIVRALFMRKFLSLFYDRNWFTVLLISLTLK